MSFARSECTFVIMIMAHVSPMHIHVHMKAQKAKKMAYPKPGGKLLILVQEITYYMYMNYTKFF